MGVKVGAFLLQSLLETFFYSNAYCTNAKHICLYFFAQKKIRILKQILHMDMAYGL